MEDIRINAFHQCVYIKVDANLPKGVNMQAIRCIYGDYFSLYRVYAQYVAYNTVKVEWNELLETDDEDKGEKMIENFKKNFSNVEQITRMPFKW